MDLFIYLFTYLLNITVQNYLQLLLTNFFKIQRDNYQFEKLIFPDNYHNMINKQADIFLNIIINNIYNVINKILYLFKYLNIVSN